MSNFKNIVTNFSIGAISKSKVAFYAKRLSRETATRRLASVLMIGLLIFQFITFVAPPKPSYASSANDLISGGPFSKSSLINKVWGQNPNGIQQVFGRLQISQAKMQAASTGSACKGQGWLSMGRQNIGNSSEFQPGIYIGTAESRWNTNCLSVILGKDKIQDTSTGQWYEWGVALDCGNIILRRTAPPAPTKTIVCDDLNSNNPGPVKVGAEVGYRGYAKGTNVSPGEKVNMAYGVYKPNGTELGQQIGDLKHADGIADSPQGSFKDPNVRNFTFNQAGTFVVRLWVSYNSGGTAVIAPGSASGKCAITITVQSEPAAKKLVCQDLVMKNYSGVAPFTPTLKGKADVTDGSGADPKPSKYEYTLYKESPSETAQTIKMNGKFYLPVSGVAKIVHPNTTLRDPAGEPPTTATFNADSFKRTEPGNYLITLRVYDKNNNAVADTKDCWAPFTVTGVNECRPGIPQGDPRCTEPPNECLPGIPQGDPRCNPPNECLPGIPQGDPRCNPPVKSFSCIRLTASPDSSVSAPLITTLTAQSSAENTTIKEYQFDFGDGNRQNVSSSQLSQSVQHTYNRGGRYNARVVVVPNDSSATSSNDTCTITINVEEQLFQKTVKNLTLLTNDGKPSDANNVRARGGDKLTYTIGMSNIGATTINGFVFRDDISDILEYANLVDPGGARLEQRDGHSVLVWPATDVPPTPNDANPVFVSREFTVQLKNPLPTTAQKPTDQTNFDCMVQDDFFGKLVKTPLYVNPAKRVECSVVAVTAVVSTVLPRTGSEALPLLLIGFFAACSLYLYFRNRLLKREIELVETLSDGVTPHV